MAATIVDCPCGLNSMYVDIETPVSNRMPPTVSDGHGEYDVYIWRCLVMRYSNALYSMSARPPGLRDSVVDQPRSWNGVMETVRTFAGRYYRADGRGRFAEDDVRRSFNMSTVFAVEASARSSSIIRRTSAKMSFISSSVYFIGKVN
jgi:hypothetical protein